MTHLFLPSLRGIFGDWVYYSCLMKAGDLASRVRLAREIYESTSLTEVLQRELKDKWARKIAKYLTEEPERFFNSLIIAVYAGEPRWFQLEGIANADDYIKDEIPEDVLNSLGVLALNGQEKLFVLDGQHRLTGIKKAVETNSDLNTEELSVVFIAHRPTPEGIARSRRLFTALNRHAKPVSEVEKIILDEDDLAAIITRQLAREYSLFQGDRLSQKSTKLNLLPSETNSFTTLVALYKAVTLILKFNEHKEKRRYKSDEITHQYNVIKTFFDELQTCFPALQQTSLAPDDKLSSVISKHRTLSGGHIAFRPKGFLILVELALTSTAFYKKEGWKRLEKLPVEISEKPFADTVWDTKQQKWNNKGNRLALEVARYMLSLPLKSKTEDHFRLLIAQFQGVEVDNIELPRRIVFT
jgi:DNA sulfur modification protein DndB